MASESLSEKSSTHTPHACEIAVSRLVQVIALVRIIGIAIEYGPSEGLPVEDACEGVARLLEEACTYLQHT